MATDPSPYLLRYGYCPYCLCIKDYTANVCVRYTSESLQHRVIAVNPTNPVWLNNWVDTYREYDDAVFEINEYQNAFIPVAFIDGTPVCPVHLWQKIK
jgi:hypothetical protein